MSRQKSLVCDEVACREQIVFDEDVHISIPPEWYVVCGPHDESGKRVDSEVHFHSLACLAAWVREQQARKPNA